MRNFKVYSRIFFQQVAEFGLDQDSLTVGPVVLTILKLYYKT